MSMHASTPEPAPLPAPRRSTPLRALLAAAALLLVTFHLHWQIGQVVFPYALDYEEGNILNAVARIEARQSIYPPHGELPSIINPYPPVYYYVSAAATAVLGYSFMPGRLVSLGASLVLAVLIGLGVFRLSGSKAAAIILPAIFWVTAPARAWSVFMRVDALAVMLAFAGFYLAVFSGRRRIAVAFFLAGFLTKHTMLAAPLATAVWLCLEGQRREAAKVGLSFLAGAVLAFGALGWATGGSFFVYMFATHGEPGSLFKWLQDVSYLSGTIPVVMAPAVWLVAGTASTWFKQRRAGQAPSGGRFTRAVTVYFLAALAASLTGMKAGSSWNHYLEFFAVVCLAAGVGVGELARRGWSPALWWSAIIVQVLSRLTRTLPAEGLVSATGIQAAALALAGGAAAYWAARPPDPAGKVDEDGGRVRRAVASVLVGIVVLGFPTVPKFSLFVQDLWPAVLAAAAMGLLLAGRPVLAGIAALGATVAAAALTPAIVPVGRQLLKERRRLGALILATAVACAALLAREADLVHSPWSAQAPWRLLEHVWTPATAVLLVALAAALSRPRGPVVLHAAASLSFLLLFRDVRLWIEFGVAACLLASAAFWMPWKRVTALVVVALSVQLWVLIPGEVWRHERDEEKLREVHAAVAAAPDPVLAEMPGLLAVTRRPMLVSNPFVFKQSAKYFPETALLEKLRRQEIRLVVMLADPWSPGFPRNHPAWSQEFVRILKEKYRRQQAYEAAGQTYYFIVPAVGTE